MTTFAQEQAELAARDGLRHVFLDPDGTLPDWLFVVVRAATGVVYATQCAGLAVEVRLVEGYLVPLGGSKFDADGSAIEIDPLRQVFHDHGDCQPSWTGAGLPPERFARLARMVESIPYWRCDARGDGVKSPLTIDSARNDQIAEGWIPVVTPDGPGVLLYSNCD